MSTVQNKFNYSIKTINSITFLNNKVKNNISSYLTLNYVDFINTLMYYSYIKMSIKNIDKIKKNKLFEQTTKKNGNYIEFLRNRINPNVDSAIAEEMINFALSEEQFFCILEKIEKDCFCNKKPTKQPVIHIVVAQAGAGKSSVSNLIKQKMPNIVFIDSDKYKKYNPLKDLILQHCPTYFGYLTGLDSYLHRDYIYNKAINQKYNILIEVTPSTKEGLFNIDLNNLKDNGYKIVFNLLAVSKIDSLISIHERYEQELETSNCIPKLTDFDRAIDSVEAINKIAKQLYNTQYDLNLFTRENNNTLFVSNDKHNCLNIFEKLQQKNFEIAKQHAKERIETIKQKMQKRNAPIEQINQFEKIICLIEKECGDNKPLRK